MKPIHFAAKGLGRVEAVCGYALEGSTAVYDKRRERFTSNESDVTCALCRAHLDEAVKDPVAIVESPRWKAVRKVVLGERELEILAGRREETAPQWPTWRSAVRAYAYFRGSFTLRSSSDPGRFEALPQAQHVANGDAAQRAAEHVAIVGRALGYVPSPARELVILRVAGRPTPRRVKTRGGAAITKGLYLEWIGCDGEEAAQITGLPEGSHDKLVRIAGCAIEDLLYGRGLLVARDEWLRRIEVREDEDVDGRKRLCGWKAIADHLVWSEDRVQRAREWEPAIPVRKVGGIWEAYADELDAWRDAGPVAKSVVP